MTIKGNIIRSILNQDKNLKCNKFKEDKNKYIILLFIYGFCASLLSLKYIINEKFTSKYKMLIKVLHIITIIVPPIFPICLSLGLGKSIKRLKNHNIKCINKEKINVNATIDTICFEPTNVLCENDIELVGIQPVIEIKNSEEKSIKIFDKVYQNNHID